MRQIAITYVLVINIVGLILTGMDKRKARRGSRRISERALFLVALLFGSVGVLTGMLLFHHKTRKLRFTLGIPILLVLQLVVSGLLFYTNHQQEQSPSQVVQSELDRILALDDETIRAWVSSDLPPDSNLSSGESRADLPAAFREFFRAFSYRIHQETITGNQATVTVQISNIDAHALAKDLCTEMMKRSVSIFPDENMRTTSDYYELLQRTILANDYETVVTNARFDLQKENGRWKIKEDERLEDELVGGLISDMNNPYLLSASEVLAIHLDALKELNEEQWIQYLAIDDLFSIGNTDYASAIDQAYAQQLKESFDYEIISCEEHRPDAEAVVRIKSVDMTKVLSQYRASLLSYALNTPSLGDSGAALSDEASRLLLEALTENKSTAKTEVSLSFSNDGAAWEIYFEPDFINAVMGNLDTAIQKFASSGAQD